MAPSKWDGNTALNLLYVDSKWKCTTYVVVDGTKLEMCTSSANTVPEATVALKSDILDRITSLEALLRRIERVEEGMNDDEDHTKTKAFRGPMHEM